MSYKPGEGDFLSRAELLAIAREVIADADGRAMAIGGGLAMQLYGSDRLTRDVDIIASVAPRTGERLTFGGRRFRLRNVPVDVIVRSDQWARLYRSGLRNRVTLSGWPVVSKDHLAAMKMVAGRDKDLGDLKTLIKLSSPSEIKTMRATIVKFLGPYAGEEFDAEVELAAWEKSTGRDRRARRRR